MNWWCRLPILPYLYPEPEWPILWRFWFLKWRSSPAAQRQVLKVDPRTKEVEMFGGPFEGRQKWHLRFTGKTWKINGKPMENQWNVMENQWNIMDNRESWKIMESHRGLPFFWWTNFMMSHVWKSHSCSIYSHRFYSRDSKGAVADSWWTFEENKNPMTPAGSGPPGMEDWNPPTAASMASHKTPQESLEDQCMTWTTGFNKSQIGLLIIFNWYLKIAYRLLLAYRHYMDGFGLCCICVCNCMHICIVKGWNLGHCFESVITCPNQCAEESLVNAWWLQLAAESGTLVQLPCVYSKQSWEPGYLKSHDF